MLDVLKTDRGADDLHLDCAGGQAADHVRLQHCRQADGRVAEDRRPERKHSGLDAVAVEAACYRPLDAGNLM
jgi:hypothetical protein